MHSLQCQILFLIKSPERTNLLYFLIIANCVLKQTEVSLGKDNSKLLLEPSFSSGQQMLKWNFIDLLILVRQSFVLAQSRN